MAKPVVLFVFNDPPGSQWVSVTGDTATTGFCTPGMGLVSDGNGDVVLTGTGPSEIFRYGNKDVTLYPSNVVTLSVPKGKAPRFSFLVVDKKSSATAYALCGLALKRNASALRAGGGSSFPELKVNTESSGITLLTLKNDPNGQQVGYDFWVMAQNAVGDVGLIDPLITNQ
jgi:hypothetical protein